MTLKPISRSNLETLRNWRNSWEIRKWCRQVGFISELDQELWYQRQNDDRTIKMFEIHSIDSLVGVAGFTSIDHIHRRAEFSLYIGTEHQRKGYARDGLKLLIELGFDELNLNLIWGECFSGNPALQLFKELGFHEDGVRSQFYFKDGKLIDAHLVSLLRSEC